MYWFILIFILLPAIEIGIFIWSGNVIGGWSVVGLIILSGMIGAALVKKEGLETWKKAQLAMYNREVPREEIIDGICIILGGILLIAPGFVTDILGFLLVLPWTRPPFKKLISFLIIKRISKGNIIFRRW
ncbi:FxsA family protein [Pseudogracilibacillus sp. SO30301A]|uniref:FxsA family protein n=1 Tax=Pseudogracilibacillus sp. SO30301A TaxID=3098291 RepID=UPI00300DD97D